MVELKLHDSQIVSKECLVIASMPHLESLKVLDLSCNPIGLAGLCNLLGQTSRLESLEQLELYSCAIEAPASAKSVMKNFNKQLIPL